MRIFSKAEAKLSGYGARPALGKDFFTDIAPCMANSHFKGRIDKARTAGALSISSPSSVILKTSDRELSIRVQSAKDGGAWIAIQRENSSS